MIKIHDGAAVNPVASETTIVFFFEFYPEHSLPVKLNWPGSASHVDILHVIVTFELVMRYTIK